MKQKEYALNSSSIEIDLQGRAKIDKQGISRSLGFFLLVLVSYGFAEIFLLSEDHTRYGLYYRPVRFALYFYIISLLLGMQKKDLSLQPYLYKFNRLVYFMVLLVTIILIGAYIGMLNGNPFWYSDTTVLLEMMFVIIAAYISIKDVIEVRMIFRSFMMISMVLSILQTVNYMYGLYGGFSYVEGVGFYTLIILLGYCISFARLLSEYKLKFFNIFSVIIYMSGCLIAFHKPLVWCWFVSSIFIIARMLFERRTGVFARFLVILCAISGVIFLANSLLSFDMIDNYRNLFYDKYLHETTGDISGGRFFLWQTGWSLFLQHPLTGLGLGVGIDLNVAVIVLHNIYLYFLVCFGLLGALPILGIIIIFFVLVLRNMRIDKDADIKVGLIGFIIAIFAYNAVGMMLFFVPVVYLFGISIGIALKLALTEACFCD